MRASTYDVKRNLQIELKENYKLNIKSTTPTLFYSM